MRAGVAVAARARAWWRGETTRCAQRGCGGGPRRGSATRVKREASAYQRCGDVRYGFSEVACVDCEASRLVAFCCKGEAGDRAAVSARVSAWRAAADTAPARWCSDSARPTA